MIFKFNKQQKIFLLLLIAVFILILQNNLYKENTSFLETAAVTITSPPENIFFNANYNFKKFTYNITHFNYLAKENDILKKENLILNKKNIKLSFLKSENIELKDTLNLKEKIPRKVIAAEIVSRPPDSWFELITINKGKKAGVEDETVVVSSEGLVGKVIKVYPYNSLVQLVTDPKCIVPAQLLSENHYTGIVYGYGAGLCIMKYLENSAKIKIGENVVTSGNSQIFPEGILIGKVITNLSLEEDLYKNIKIKPAVNFSKLRYVVLVKYEE